MASDEPRYTVVSARVVSYNRATQRVIARPVSIGGIECAAIPSVPVVFPTTGAAGDSVHLNPGDPLLLVYRHEFVSEELIAIPGFSL